jgi:hypothetical protein
MTDATHTTSARKPRPTLSIVQVLVRRDRMMAGLISIRSFDAAVGMLSAEDRIRYYAP